MENLPEVLLDADGYPTEEWLEYLRNYKPTDEMPVDKFVRDILIDGWYFSDWGFVLKGKYKGRRKLELHTGGWSGNEDVINALLSNIMLTHFALKYVMWRTGGHYYFVY